MGRQAASCELRLDRLHQAFDAILDGLEVARLHFGGPEFGQGLRETAVCVAFCANEGALTRPKKDILRVRQVFELVYGQGLGAVTAEANKAS